MGEREWGMRLAAFLQDTQYAKSIHWHENSKKYSQHYCVERCSSGMMIDVVDDVTLHFTDLADGNNA